MTHSSSMADETTFRKPSIPASALRQQPETRAKFSQQRRTSQLRENARVPSGPREFPSPGRRVGNSSISSLTPSMADSPNTTRPALSNTISEPQFGRNGDTARFSFGNPSSNDDTDSPTTPAERTAENFDFLPSVNFDDFQNSLANYDSSGSLLNQFPLVGSGSITPKEVQNTTTVRTDDSGPLKPEPKGEPSLTRGQSLRRRLSAATGPKRTTGQSGARDGPSLAVDTNNLSFRSRRQSSVPQGALSGPAPPPIGAGSRAPRKSVGPGLLTSMMESRKTSQPLPNSSSESTLKTGLGRTASLSRATRSTTLGANAQSRQNKTKSLLPPPRNQDPNTPSGRPVSKGSSSIRAHTPSSSGNKRQSIASGRASGLGARTISPTDTRRLKRLSMMQPPPMPTALPKEPPTPQDDPSSMKIELPRLTQPSPSLIPRKTNNATPSSARASPDGRFGSGGVPLSSKSSFQSLVNSSSSQSRLPTPKSRNVHSSSAQYADDEEMVPPVPAIPKGYGSPKDSELQFFSESLKNSLSASTTNESMVMDFDNEVPLSAISRQQSRPSIEASRRKQSGESTRSHKRTNTIDEMDRNGNVIGAKAVRQPPDLAGRKNNNLQPLRLPPLNLMPINTPTTYKIAGLPRPTDEIDQRGAPAYTQTPEPKRVAKTPSTPMTASKATFMRRQDDDFSKPKNIRASSSHFALRDLLHLDAKTTNFFDEDDADVLGGGIPIGGTHQRNAITPFASGSLPKGSGEYMRQLGRPSADYADDYTLGRNEELQLHSAKPQGPRHGRSATNASLKTTTPSSLESPTVESAQSESKKESSGGGLRRRLSFGWRRSGSKAANLADLKSSPPEEVPSLDKDKTKAQKRLSEMPPPRLPASATWSGDVPTLPPSTTRPSLDLSFKKPALPATNTFPIAGKKQQSEQIVPTLKTNTLRPEQPQAVSASASKRSSSWGAFGINQNAANGKPGSSNVKGRGHISAIAKDKDDIAADDEMRRLSQKRRDVDTAARESEDLRRRANARSPMSPEQVLHDRTCTLNIFERGEIMEYEKDGVYFTGNKNARKVIGNLAPSPLLPDDKGGKAGNYGYDDERGDYNIVIGDHLAYRYEVIDILGKGSFGQVVRCIDYNDGGVVAVKIIRNKKRFHQQALVEVGILGRLREWDPDGHHATLSITSSFYFRSHLCIVTPCLSINLYELIRAHNFVGFSLSLIRRFSRQLLACLVLLQNKRIIHCDLKPENILLCEARKADVRVIDFGSSCKEEEKVYTYIQSRFYRSPEVILGSSYGLGIDMWSFGCILAELWTGYPIFPGENEQEQLACIMEIFGPPDRHLVERCTRKKLFFDSVGKPRVTVSSKGRRRRPSSKTLSQALKTEDEAFLDFIARCLRWDPDRRLKPHDAVNHPFITNAPFNQRPGIPGEARRAAKLRPTAAVPTTNGSIPSPVKRTSTLTGATGMVGTAAPTATLSQTQTPARERRPLPETPQTALRNGPPATVAPQAQGSPSKPTVMNRRHSTAPNANFATAAGTKRTSNGAVVGPGMTAGPGAQRQLSGSIGTNNLAALAARESMSTTNSARWRS